LFQPGDTWKRRTAYDNRAGAELAVEFTKEAIDNLNHICEELGNDLKLTADAGCQLEKTKRNCKTYRPKA
jgi:hypothetical protein